MRKIQGGKSDKFETFAFSCSCYEIVFYLNFGAWPRVEVKKKKKKPPRFLPRFLSTTFLGVMFDDPRRDASLT